MTDSFSASSDKYWYRFTYSYCPVCGGGETYKERVYTPKPEDPAERHIYEDAYDHCLEFGAL